MTADDLAMYNQGVTAMEVLIFWLFCAALGAGFGRRRGEMTGGFFLGLLLGPFGVVIAYFGAGNYEPCPFCRELRHPAATACPHCQRDLAPKA